MTPRPGRPTPALTLGERRIVARLACGRTLTQAAHDLDLKFGSAKAALNRACTRLSVTGQAAAVHAAYRTGNLAGHPAEPRPAITLTPDRHRVLHAIADGHTIAAAARHLRLSRYAVDRHIAVLLGQFNANTRAHLVALAHQHGQLTTPTTQEQL